MSESQPHLHPDQGKTCPGYGDQPAHWCYYDQFYLSKNKISLKSGEIKTLVYYRTLCKGCEKLRVKHWQFTNHEVHLSRTRAYQKLPRVIAARRMRARSEWLGEKMSVGFEEKQAAKNEYKSQWWQERGKALKAHREKLARRRRIRLWKSQGLVAGQQFTSQGREEETAYQITATDLKGSNPTVTLLCGGCGETVLCNLGAWSTNKFRKCPGCKKKLFLPEAIRRSLSGSGE